MKPRKILLFSTIVFFLSCNFMILNKSISILSNERDIYYNTNILPTGSAALDFTLKDITSGNMKTFSSFEGKVVVLGFFTSYGEYDSLMMDVYKDIQSTYSSSKVVVMMIAMDPTIDDEAMIQSIIDAYEITWMVFIDDGTIAPYYEITVSPGIYLITKNQNTYYGKNGPVPTDLEFLSPKIDAILPADPTTDPGGSIPEFWQKNWIWIMLGGIGTIVLSGLLIYRRRIIVHNKKIRAEKLKLRQQKARKRNR